MCHVSFLSHEHTKSIEGMELRSSDRTQDPQRHACLLLSPGSVGDTQTQRQPWGSEGPLWVKSFSQNPPSFFSGLDVVLQGHVWDGEPRLPPSAAHQPGQRRNSLAGREEQSAGGKASWGEVPGPFLPWR